jgi:hypothetical protein
VEAAEQLRAPDSPLDE